MRTPIQTFLTFLLLASGLGSLHKLAKNIQLKETNSKSNYIKKTIILIVIYSSVFSIFLRLSKYFNLS